MKLQHLLTASAFVFATGTAFAADLPTHKAPPPPPVITPWSWTGFYVGGYAGGAWGNTSVSDPVYGGTSSGPGGFTIGGYVGANYEFAGGIVVGAEGEYGYEGGSAASTTVTGVLAPNAYNLTQKFNDTGIGRLRARLGYAIQPNILLYAAGGWSFGNTNGSLSGNYGGIAFSDSSNLSPSGWNVGGGVEYAVTPNWIVRAEYIYDGFGSHSTVYPLPLGFVATRSISYDQSTVRGGVEYKF